jgi:hypothetical protein
MQLLHTSKRNSAFHENVCGNIAPITTAKNKLAAFCLNKMIPAT